MKRTQLEKCLLPKVLSHNEVTPSSGTVTGDQEGEAGFLEQDL